MIYITEKERFYSKSWLGAKKLDCVWAWVYDTPIDFPKADAFGLQGTLREYSVAGWKELLSRPDVYYRADAEQEFAPLAGLKTNDWAK